MNYKHLIKPVAVLALFCGAPVLQAQILGGGAGGGLGGSLGGTLGGGMGSIGGMGQGNANGTLGGSLERTGELRRHATGAVDRTRETTGHVRDRVATTRDTVQNTASVGDRMESPGSVNTARQCRGQCRRQRQRFAVGCDRRGEWRRERKCGRRPHRIARFREGCSARSQHAGHTFCSGCAAGVAQPCRRWQWQWHG